MSALEHEWLDYERRFRDAARQTERTAEYVYACLAYARPLWFSGLPIIYDVTHFARLVGYSSDYVLASAYGAEAFYREFKVKKASGGDRQLSEPLPSLKEIQRWMLDKILHQVPPSAFAKGFVRKRSIKDNARFHRRQQFVLSLDIEDFFPSIRRPRVYGLFRSLGYSQQVANLLGRLSCLNDALPQGAPTSPAISNLVCRILDARIAGFARKHRIRFTRYADDITLSGNFAVNQAINFVRRVLHEEGLVLNEKKTRLMERHQQQEVTGIVVNEEMRAPRNLKRSLRQRLHYIEKYGLNSHLIQIGEKRANYVRHLLGVATFILFVDPDDTEVRHYREVLHTLLLQSDQLPDDGF